MHKVRRICDVAFFPKSLNCEFRTPVASYVIQTYDDAAHPVDITQSWAECDNIYCDYVEIATSMAITCAAGKIGPCRLSALSVEKFNESVVARR